MNLTNRIEGTHRDVIQMLNALEMDRMRNKVSEKDIQKAICDYLSLIKDCMFWRNNTTGVYDPKKGIMRLNNSKYSRNGVADILGIYKGKPLAIEVKSPTGRVSDAQKAFLEEFASQGGIAILARSIEDVRKGLSIE